MEKPKIICICGSTKFAYIHMITKWQFEKKGIICLTISVLPDWYSKLQGLKGNNHFAEQSGAKEILDELHLRKIDLSDEVFVVNLNGYIGESTQNEIRYAIKTGKPVRYLEPV